MQTLCPFSCKKHSCESDCILYHNYCPYTTKDRDNNDESSTLCFDYHIRRIVRATMDLWKEENSICHKCHAPASINCLLCYCPRYELGMECGGNFVILDNGIKDCSNCTIPHDPVFVEEYIRNRLL